MKVQILKEEIKIRVRRDDKLKLELAEMNGIKVSSLDRWLREDSLMLTTVTNLQIIRDYFNLDGSVELTEEKETQTA